METHTNTRQDTIECYIIFTDSEESFWENPWRLLTHKGFRHVQVLTYCMEGAVADYFVLVDPGTGWLATPLALIEDEQQIKDYYPNSKIVRVVKVRDRKITIRGLYSCVAVIKQMLAVTWYTVLTPKGLYKRLLQEGYQEI